MRRPAVYGISVAMIVSFHTALLAQGEAVKLFGREAEAVNLATRDFIAKHYSRSGDLRHYGLCVTYIVSLSPPKITRFYFAR